MLSIFIGICELVLGLQAFVYIAEARDDLQDDMWNVIVFIVSTLNVILILFSIIGSIYFGEFLRVVGIISCLLSITMIVITALQNMDIL